MGDYYIIAAGGTGAMCARSFIYMAAAGCADQKATYHVLLVDKDKESDAITSCENLLADYEAMRAQLGDTPGSFTFPKVQLHKWNFTDEIVDEYIKQTGRPASDLTNLTLGKLLNPYKDATIGRILATMYSESELDTDLEKGFYGHPNIGAPVFDYVKERFLAPQVTRADGTTVRNGFMSSLHESLRTGKAHVYLFGSLFGGTGATVIPNVALALTSMRDPKNPTNRYGKDRLILGGSVIMPYFRLPSCETDNKEALEKIAPVDGKFAGQTKEALQYYHESGLLDNMMNLMLLGTSKLDVTSEAFSRGGSQTQHFHMVLLLAASAANRFFANELGSMAEGLKDENVEARKELLLWKVTPNDPTNSGRYRTLTPEELHLGDEYRKLATFLRFSVVVAYYMRLKFDKNPDDLKYDVEILGTARQMKKGDKFLDPRNISQNDIIRFYQEPVAKAGSICRGFISFMFDVALSGYDWSKYRVNERGQTPVFVNDRPYYTYTLKGVSPDAADYFDLRWMDFANLLKLKELLDSDITPSDVVKKMTLNEISSFTTRDEEHQGYQEFRFPNSIAQVYEAKVLHELDLEKNIFGKMKKENVYFSQIYDQLYKMCE